MGKVRVERYTGCGEWKEMEVEENEVRTKEEWGFIADEILGSDVSEEFEKLPKHEDSEVER